MECVIFDVDGVIVNSEKYWKKEKEKIIEEAFSNPESVSPEDLTGIPVLDQYDKFSDKYNMKVNREEYYELYDKRAESIYTEKSSLMDDFHILLDKIKEKEALLGIASSSYSNWINMVLERFDLEDRFDIVMTADDLEAPGKPQPYIYERVAKELKIDTKKCIVIEDSESGILAAKRAGMYCIVYRNNENKKYDLPRTDKIVQDSEDLQEKILEII